MGACDMIFGFMAQRKRESHDFTTNCAHKDFYFIDSE